MIEICNLYKNYGKNNVLKNINITIENSQITAIAGPNGSGKTTLIKSILGLVKLDKGYIKVNHQDISNNYIYRDSIGYMPQIGRYPDNQTISDVFKMINNLRGRSNTDKLEELIDIFRLKDYLAKKMSALSGGTRQKVSAVLSLMFEPEILIMDEPTTGLDPISASKLKELILLERTKGRTIIIISHIMSEVEELADKLIYLLEGEITIQDTIVNLQSKDGDTNLERSISKILKEEYE